MKNDLLGKIQGLGLNQFQEEDILADYSNQKKSGVVTANTKEKTEADYLLVKTYVCPVCGKEFKTLKVKSNKPRLLGTDPDMRPLYKGIDVTKYDSVVCQHCGYAALAKTFDQISDTQIRNIRTEICSRFKGLPEIGSTYTYDEAITRFQLALASAIIKRVKISERAYICLKLAWLYRGKRNELIAPDEKRTKELYRMEFDYIKKALAGFQNARLNEMFPIMGMDEWTFTFLTAELSIECNDYQEARRLIAAIIYSKGAPDRVKDKARDLKDYLNDLMQE